jgi:ethanolamine utilization protein EutA (predicted chaperonin)
VKGVTVADAGIVKGMDDESRLDAMISHLETVAPRLSNRASRSASSRLDAVQKILVYRSIETYDPADKGGFAQVVQALSEHVPDHGALAGLFGISVSTLYRWKSGESVPQQLARMAVKEHLLNLLGAAAESGGDPDGPPRPRSH